MKFKDLYSLNYDWCLETVMHAGIYKEREIYCLVSCRYLLHEYGEYTVSCFGSDWIELIAGEVKENAQNY